MSLVPDAEMFCKSHLKRKVSWFTSLLFDAEIPQLGLSFAELGFREGNPSHSENHLFCLEMQICGVSFSPKACLLC